MNLAQAATILITALAVLIPDPAEAHENPNRKLEESLCSESDYSYPDGLQTPPLFGPGVGTYIAATAGITQGVSKSETPIAIRTFSLIDAAAWNCIAAYDTTKLDALRTGKRPVVEVPVTVCGDTDAHTTAARVQCFVHMYAAALPTLAPDAVPDFQSALERLSTDYTTSPPRYTGAYPIQMKMGIDSDVQACSKGADDYEAYKSCVEQIAEAYEYVPAIMGSIIAQDMLMYSSGDGWNADGMDNGRCKNNCLPFSDTIGYEPKNVYQRKKAFKRKWQPLMESDGRGFFYRQEHVTPHIGLKAVPRVLSRKEVNSRKVEKPLYNLEKEAGLVTERLSSLDDEKKMAIELFDNKVNVINLLSRGLLFRYLSDFTFERVILFSTVYMASEYDAVILAWKEKVRHDLVRPTTVIQQRRYNTPENITTWAGPYKGVETFSAKEFQPYIRVMPHAEYPSGSGCICQSNIDVTKAYMKLIFNDDGEGYFLSETFKAGSSLIEPGVTPAEELTLFFHDLESVREACGQSRLDGGMHFTAAVENSYGLCVGFEEPVTDYMLTLLNGSDDLITTYVPRPPTGGP
uniref:Vanadium-dependent haloperoxidase NapH1-like second helical-bundle domain-containing protein n=1 Tax=Helicotheca tamesis TaxID=374047 RepID=A0A7S2GXC0_9STRA|mmetsp:Transcript_13055/g.17984  ORF Transcript_13055/g.17984 Transcript_13055/m.17984 type:complete len:575 (+) Transcript_13055:84-1808(+)|eukprot:CAMPEP_0185729502 /NCGR_PEP_ID=MMETSP1171-20130828/6278_1 /TAXON_ID=374046 /ORGANISM="Helicotheca tamensis, Strain CCMP826" /LENGTH=574 /DNA_ID=CAMNT_0028398365 /DNA_START=31 /DNA_END=1755 /DNA_ORIENTATION=+